MLEIGIFCVILLAAGYWATMFVMGRRDDVIHGKFVHSEHEGAFTQAAMPAPRFPDRPVKTAEPVRIVPAHDAAAEPVTSDALQSLLAAIQQDLKSVA
ncbi:hypothetical protein [Bradyrhizobium monzae]|uniref:hypothetical protein n=1 Tax=Bradyrhizobium sp. Oc8 TaxID=2876780 RepID=UPI001F467716|nr:hypothetical protein [Bradyrhizobium sp. Oc8]